MTQDEKVQEVVSRLRKSSRYHQRVANFAIIGIGVLLALLVYCVVFW